MKPYFGEGSLTQSLKEQRDNWYEDVLYHGFSGTGNVKSRIDRIDEKALYYRAPYTSVGNVLPYYSSSSDTIEIVRDQQIDPAEIVDLTGKC